MEISIGNRKRIWIADEAIYIETKDAKIGKEPFSDYPRLKNASASERKNYTTSVFGLH